MIRLAVSVEGQPEEAFVKSVLAPHLRLLGVEPTPILLGNARGSGVSGGNVNMGRLSMEMATLLWTHDAVSSLFDFYGFAKKGERTIDELEENLIQDIQQRVSDRWDQRRIIPYVQKHEFEGLLFSDVSAFGVVMMNVPVQRIARLNAIRVQFQTPEDINDNPDTAPSKRIMNMIPGYRKRLHSTLVAGEVGLPVIRRECPRFDNWVERLESLTTTLQ